MTDDNLDRKLALIEKKFNQIHKGWCTYGRATGDDGDFCNCGLRERKDAIQEEIDKL